MGNLNHLLKYNYYHLHTDTRTNTQTQSDESRVQYFTRKGIISDFFFFYQLRYIPKGLHGKTLVIGYYMRHVTQWTDKCLKKTCHMSYANVSYSHISWQTPVKLRGHSLNFLTWRIKFIRDCINIKQPIIFFWDCWHSTINKAYLRLLTVKKINHIYFWLCWPTNDKV